MNTRPFFSAFALALLVLASPAYSQYMYLDSNGDGIHTAADKLHPVNPTVVDIWFDTAHNRDGSATFCHTDPSTPLDMFSYVVNLLATNGTVSYSAYTNRLAGWNALTTPHAPDDTRFTTGGFYDGFPGLPPGKYLLGTLTITVETGFPAVDIVAYLPGTEFSDPTLFGTPCEENADESNSAILGRDWFDVDGLARPGRGSSAATNRLSAAGSLAFMTARGGAATMRLFDVRGRLVRTLLDTPFLNAGAHEISFDGRDGNGARLSKGVYFYRVDSTAGKLQGRIAVVR